MNNICGAKTRSGAPCKRSPLAGKRRCRLHGGLSTGAANPARPGNQNARKHGCYSDRVTPEELALMPTIPVGSVDDELALMRILPMRALRDERELLDAGDTVLEVVRIKHGPDNTETMRRLVLERLDRNIDRLIARIASLEGARAKL